MRAMRLAVIGLICAHSLAAQARVVQSQTPLDSTRTAVRDALLILRDSLGTVDAAAARLQRDFRLASGASLLSRARVMHAACARSARTIPPTRKAVVAADLAEPGQRKRRNDLLMALDQLGGTLTRCETEFAAMSRAGQAETVRGYANDRAVKVQGDLRKYEQILRDFFGALDIKVMPLGSSNRPASG
jgi:hypothetical protein